MRVHLRAKGLHFKFSSLLLQLRLLPFISQDFIFPF
jgi:hypothetical protein